jgi:predicted alternative tryptophan synthase beta-subunit
MPEDYGITAMRRFSVLYHKKLIENSVRAKEVFEAASLFAQKRRDYPCAGINPRGQTCDRRSFGQKRRKEKTILFNLRPRSFLDLGAYEEFLEGRMK